MNHACPPRYIKRAKIFPRVKSEGDEDYFSQKLHVRIKDHKNSPHVKFHRFLFPFFSKFSDLNLSRNKFVRALANQPISAPHFFNPQQIFLLRVKLIKKGEKRETSTKTCNETMLRDMLRAFVSCISPP